MKGSKQQQHKLGRPGARTAKQSGRGPATTTTTCKTCTSCRQKKVKCCGTRPRCTECVEDGLQCNYPRDARKDPRPSWMRVQQLEQTIASILGHMESAGIVPPQLPNALLETDSGSFVAEQEQWESAMSDQDKTAHEMRLPESHLPRAASHSRAAPGHLASTAAAATPLPTPSASSVNGPENDASHPSHAADDASARPETAHLPIQQASVSMRPLDGTNDSNASAAVASPALSPCEARVAGVFHEHGCVSSVHGLAGIMNPTLRAQHKKNLSKLTRGGKADIDAARARLVSNASVQRQKEARLFRQPVDLLELDGCDPELARHLIALHFNRQHFAYLISYRPAIMDSLASGGGPWCNKLLLNALYYSSSLYSDRPCVLANPNDPQSAGAYFYDRFRQLLVYELDKPSIPTAVALLLTSATLVSQGRSSAGWALSGTAYRMILDLGCHLMLGPDYGGSGSSSSSLHVLRGDLEREMRKRLYWGAYTTDATQSLYLGRPCMFASIEARVPLQFLDTYEELEEWEPLADPCRPSAANVAYCAQPAHAISAFSALARLLQISTTITELYGIQTIKWSTEVLLKKKRDVETALRVWQETLPEHLRFEPDNDAAVVPPPHQITPHTTFHALTIMLQRAFLEEGHFHRHTDNAAKKSGEQVCVESALSIERLARAYRNAFTLRRAPFLLSYAIYSAVVIILHQERRDRGTYVETISFFWMCLCELQRGCNFGLTKPLAILRDMAHEFNLSIQESRTLADREDLQPMLLHDFYQFQTSGDLDNRVAVLQDPSAAFMDGQDHFGGSASSLPMNFLDEQECSITQDSLYGLFASTAGSGSFF